MKICDVYPYSEDITTFVNTAGLPDVALGIEVEVEGGSRLANIHRYWCVEEDSSLRDDGREIVLRCPLRGDDLMQALDELKGIMTNRLRVSHRCSVHVHIDVRGRTHEQISSLILAYAATEAALFTPAGKSRYSNIYCPGLTSCYSLVSELRHAVRDMDNLRSVVNCYSKYTAMNLRAIRNQGSIEFRMHEGTKDADVVKEWALRLMHFADTAMGMTPATVVKEATNGTLLRKVTNPTSDMLDNHRKYGDNNLMNCLDIYAGTTATEVAETPETTLRVRTTSPEFNTAEIPVRTVDVDLSALVAAGSAMDSQSHHEVTHSATMRPAADTLPWDVHTRRSARINTSPIIDTGET